MTVMAPNDESLPRELAGCDIVATGKCRNGSIFGPPNCCYRSVSWLSSLLAVVVVLTSSPMTATSFPTSCSFPCRPSRRIARHVASRVAFINEAAEAKRRSNSKKGARFCREKRSLG